MLIPVAGARLTGFAGQTAERHSFGPYYEGQENPYKDIMTADNVRIEKLEQRQRTLERRVRKTKREVMGLQEAVDKCPDETLDRKSYLLSRQNKAYNEFCKENSLRPLSERLQIAKWSREQAAKARGAARRYQNTKGE